MPSKRKNCSLQYGHWTLSNLTAAYQTLDRAGELEYPANHSHPLRESGRVHACHWIWIVARLFCLQRNGLFRGTDYGT